MSSVNIAVFKVQNVPFIPSQMPEHPLTAAARRTLGTKIW